MVKHTESFECFGTFIEKKRKLHFNVVFYLTNKNFKC